MSLKEILAPVIALEEDEAALMAAAELSAKFSARPTALILAVHAASTFVDNEVPLSVALEDLAGGPRSRAAQLRRGLMAWLNRAPTPFEIKDLAIEHAVDDDRIVAHARVADLVVMARAPSHDRARQAVIEDVLFKSGRPMLIVPSHPVRARRWDKIVIGWNAKAEAVRAVAAALPFLTAAKQVAIATVDATPSAAGHSDKPGREIADYLAHHGVAAEVRNVGGLGRTHGRALVDEAQAIDADLLVLGAYGHSRAREFMFGGVTRELLAGSPVPLLLAH
jgi:nucleotide-binding universal stress UspA family protein